MKSSRRDFLKTSGILASGLALGSLPALTSCSGAVRGATPFGLQLYTLRNVIGDDPEATLREVAEYGYHQIESYEGPMGIYWGMGNNGFKSLMDELGMTMVSSHANVFQDFDRKAGEAAEIGVDYLVCPWIGGQDSLDDYRAIADQFNEIGRVARSEGVRFAYHNHAYTFEVMDGVIPQDLLMEETDPDLVDFQLDMYWVAAAGHDPAEWIRRHPSRFTSCHVKDLSNGDSPESTILGRGSIEYPVILSVAKEDGMEYLIVEQEAYTDTTPMDAIRENAVYMRGLNLS